MQIKLENGRIVLNCPILVFLLYNKITIFLTLFGMVLNIEFVNNCN